MMPHKRRKENGGGRMTQEERLDRLIDLLLRERADCRQLSIPENAEGKRNLFRALVNVRPPVPASSAFLRLQDEYLRAEIAAKGIVRVENLKPVAPELYLWRGDITTLAADAIVNAANDEMLGCFVPCHGCIDNAIHTFAGVQLRLECAAQMRTQGHPEETGTARITRAYNLPCRYILHTVGPIVRGQLTGQHEAQLAACYRACLELAAQNGVGSLAFCCISTGEYHFPNRRAAEIAVETVNAYQATAENRIKVIFNVFKQTDYDIYCALLGAERADLR